MATICAQLSCVDDNPTGRCSFDTSRLLERSVAAEGAARAMQQ
jgi:hypothetical protein